MFKKMMLLASLVLAATALAAPVAQAEWTHKGVPLKEHKQITLHGTAMFHAPFGLGTFHCEDVTATITAEPGSTGSVTEFEPATETCSGTGIFTNCTLEEHSNTAPWVAHANTGSKKNKIPADITVTGPTIFNEYAGHGSGCSQASSHLNFANNITIDIIGDNEAISTVELTGTATNGATATGLLHVTEPGTYGITTGA
jgi:hypothetical protein